MRRPRTVLVLVLVVAACTSAPAEPSTTVPETVTTVQQQHRFLALGDSYTIGEGVAASERWPVQLASMLRQRGFDIEDPEIVARTGWTTAELDLGIDFASTRGEASLVSLLIGVNNQYRGLSLSTYRTEFAELLQRAIGFAGGDPNRVVVLSIPDWGVTPFANGSDGERIAEEIDAFNAVAAEETSAAGAHFVDITEISRSEPEMVTDDGLHPSGEMYRLWAEAALETVLSILG